MYTILMNIQTYGGGALAMATIALATTPGRESVTARV